MRIGEVAARAGLSVATVRLYERRGLLRQAPRSASGYRDYAPIDLEVLALIAQCRGFGFTLSEIKRLVGLCWGPNPRSNCVEEACAIGAAKLTALDAKIAELARARDALAAALGRMRGRLALLDSAPRVKLQDRAATKELRP